LKDLLGVISGWSLIAELSGPECNDGVPVFPLRPGVFPRRGEET